MTTGTALRFPAGFLWGVATSSFQIEGATHEDGRGASIWDTFSATRGKVDGGGTGDPACDHYHRYGEDVELLADLGLAAYRFSVAWPRVQPDGRGPVERRGLDFYDRLLDRLLDKGIEPVATLYHWDLPQALEDAGGWPNRDTAHRFAEYAALVHARFADRVRMWTTLNEPWCSAFLGYCSGIHAPGRQDPVAALKAAHHLLLGHGLAMRALRAQAPSDHQLSIVLNLSPVLAEDPSAGEAVRKVDGLQNRFFLDPVFGRGYPADVLADTAWLGDWQRVVADGDLDLIATPLDWYGINYYSPVRVSLADEPLAVTPGNLPGLRGVRMLEPRGQLTGFGWEQNADAFHTLLRRLGRDYPGVPMIVTENGSAFPDLISPQGTVEDPERSGYLVDHLRAVHRAVDAGVDVRGYLAWSLLDNFEWAAGYGQRFGLVHVDFETQRRTIKDSGRLFARIAAENELPV